MLFRAEGPQVGVVGNDNKVQLRSITIGRDYGATLEILGGIDVNDQIIINPSDSLEVGQQVRVAQSNQAPPNQPGSGQTNQAQPGQNQPGQGSGHS